MAKKTDLSKKNVSELKSLLAEKREELRASRFAAAGARPKDSNAHAKLRTEIARIMFELGVRARVTA